MQALHNMGYDYDIVTYANPDLDRLENVYGSNLVSMIKKANKVSIVPTFTKAHINNAGEENKYHFNINTHPDLFPFHHEYFSKENTITYCHFPMAKQFVHSKNIEYLRRDLRIEFSSDEIEEKEQYSKARTHCTNYTDRYFASVYQSYQKLMENSTVITNSEFSRRAIIKTLNNGTHEIQVIRPPVDVEAFRNNVLYSSREDEKKDIILTVCRIHRSKGIENAVRLAKQLKEKRVGDGLRVVGNITSEYDWNYYLNLKKMVGDYELEDYVTIETNVNLKRLFSIMKSAKVYFHPMVGEHFGMSVVEAMAAGLIPVVPNVGGQTEFVPLKYHFSTIEEAAEKVSSAFYDSDLERVQISNSVNRFSVSNYISEFQRIIDNLSP
jgi:glycosyltransferase involved in cell wall biosynthesis